MDFIIKGILLGLSIAAPIGPISVLCIRRTLTSGTANGFVTGLGTAMADAIYSSIAGFSITILSVFVLDNQFYLRLIGGFFLLYLGYRTFKLIPCEISNNSDNEGLFGAFVSALFLTLTNPITIISFAAAFAGLGVGDTYKDYMSTIFLVLGVFIGSMLWWLTLIAVVNLLRFKFNLNQFKWINQFTGSVIICFGIFILMSL